MANAFGSDDDDFMKLLPKKEDGQFKSDAYDALDERLREKFRKEHRQDIGYDDREIEMLQNSDELERPVSVPVDMSSGDGGAPERTPEPPVENDVTPPSESDGENE